MGIWANGVSVHDIPVITPRALCDLQAESSALTLVDVRESEEYDAVRATFGRNCPLSSLEREGLAALGQVSSIGSVFVVCRSGKRSLKAAQMLEAWGVRNVVNVTGGMLAWELDGLPVAKG